MDAAAGVTKQQVAAAALAVAVLTVSPDAALAKGGGSGDSSSSSSSSSYSSSSYSSSSTPSEPPLPDRWRFPLDRTYKGTPAQTPWYCVGMPNIGENIEVLVSPYDRYTTPVYGYAKVDRIAVGSCQFEAFQPGQPASVVTRYDGTNLIFPLALVGVVLACLAFVPSSSPSNYGSGPSGGSGFRGFSEEIVSEAEEMRDMRADVAEQEPPMMVSGEYTGETRESDGVAQGSSTKLTFGDDGRVTGSGIDEEDGPFEIVDGYWFGKKAVWFESYPAGIKPNEDSSTGAFKVAVRARYIKSMDCIKGEFCSSVRSIKGFFTLRLLRPSKNRAPREREGSTSRRSITDESKQIKDEWQEKYGGLFGKPKAKPD
jgi:hypothetical protein